MTSYATGRVLLSNWPAFIVLALTTFAFANAAIYISYAAIPFVTSDGWYFVDAFLQKYYHGGVSLQDLYIKRGADDHAQPIQKLLLIWNADYFDLDFVIEAYIGLTFAALAWLLMFATAWQDNRTRQPSSWWALPMIASSASFVSLSAPMVFNWSLVTLGYMAPLSMVMTALGTWQAVERNRWWPLLLISPLVIFTQDGSALICVAGVTAALLLRLAKLRGEGWKPILTVIGLLLITVVSYRLVSHIYLHPYITESTSTFSTLVKLKELGWENLLEMMLTVAALSVAERESLLSGFGDRAAMLHVCLGALVIAAHTWFWWRAFRDRWNQTQFLAVALMLLCYGATAGIVIGRVTIFGPDYVSQQRYLMLYQCGTVALAIMAAGCAHQRWKFVQKAVASVAFLCIIAVQVPLSQASWNNAPHVQTYAKNLGQQMLLLGQNPTQRLASCVPTLVICQADIEEQSRSIELLRNRGLNAFSNELLQRHSMLSINRPIRSAQEELAGLKIVGFGPSIIKADIDSNSHIDIWATADRSLAAYEAGLWLNDQRLNNSAVADATVTGTVPTSLLATQQVLVLEIRIGADGTELSTDPVSFNVK